METITSPSNQKVKKVVELRDHAKARRRDKLFIIEGARMFEETPEEAIELAFVTEDFIKNPVNRKKSEAVNAYRVSDEIFKKISDTVTPQGVLCVVKQPEYSLDSILNNKDAFILCLENIQDPGNLGTMIRTAEGAGISGVIMSGDTTDIFGSKVIRSTMGAIFRVPFAVTKDFVSVIGCMKEKGIKVHAAALGTDTDYTKADYKGATAVLIGNEGNGLTKASIEASGDIVTIPMEGQLESLNAAISSAIIMYEAKRQRSQ